MLQTRRGLLTHSVDVLEQPGYLVLFEASDGHLRLQRLLGRGDMQMVSGASSKQSSI